jgi:hypothetical protein
MFLEVSRLKSTLLIKNSKSEFGIISPKNKKVLTFEASLHCLAVIVYIDFSRYANLAILSAISGSDNLDTSDELFKPVMFDSFGFESELFKNMIGTQYIRKTAISTEHPPITIGFECNKSVIANSQVDFLISIGMDLDALRITMGSIFIIL